MIVHFIELIVMTLLGAIASLFLKKASNVGNIIFMFQNINLYIGGFLYIISAVLNIWILRYFDYSVVLPLTSLTYVWTMVLSYKILKEKITKQKIYGVVFILLGAVCTSI